MTHLLPVCKDLASVRESIVSDLAASQYSCVPLKHVSRRWYRTVRKYGGDLNELLNEMALAGKIGIHKFETLGRTFIFDGQYYKDCQAAYADGDNIWDNLAKSLKDYK